MIEVIEIHGFRAISDLRAELRSRSVTLLGENGAGKTTFTGAILWGLGENLDGDVIQIGRDEVRTVLRARVRGELLTITRSMKRGGEARQKVESDTEVKKSPASILAGLRKGIGRAAFSSLPPTAKGNAPSQQSIVRQLAPGLDVSDLDAQIARERTDRTRIGQQRDDYEAQARGVAIPEAPESAGEERPIVDAVDVADLVQRKADAVTQNAGNAQARRGVQQAKREADEAGARAAAAAGAVEDALEALRVARERAAVAKEAEDAAAQRAITAEQNAAQLEDVDTSQVDREIAEAREKNKAARAEAEQHNKLVRAAAAQIAERKRAEAERARITERAAEKAGEYKAGSARIAKLEDDRAARIAAAKCPVEGLALTADGALYPGKNGPVPVAELSAGERITLDVEIAAALGQQLIPVSGWGEVDAKHRGSINALARKREIQLLREQTTLTGVLEVLVEDGAPTEQPDLFT